MSNPKSSAPSVSPERIARLMKRVSYLADVAPHGTTSTFVHAYLDKKFYLATGHSACVSPEIFNREIGLEIADRDARNKAREKLWELEGYALFSSLNAAPAATDQATTEASGKESASAEAQTQRPQVRNILDLIKVLSEAGVIKPEGCGDPECEACSPPIKGVLAIKIDPASDKPITEQIAEAISAAINPKKAAA